MAQRWRLAAACSVRSVLLALAIASLALGAAITTGSGTAVGVSLLVGLTLVFFALHGAWRAAGGLVAFARSIPGEAKVQARPSGSTRLAWPSRQLSIEARSGILGRPRLEGQAAGQAFDGPADEGSMLAEEALARLEADDPAPADP